MAYPDEGDSDTDLGFNYWLEAVAKSDDTSSTDSGEGDSTGVEIKDNENVNQQLVIGEPEQNP